MPQPEIRIYSSLEELSRNGARLFCERAERVLETKGVFFSALSGGTTPRRLYELLASPEVRLPWDRIHFFQVDERCVPPDSPESNYGMIRAAFLSRTSYPEVNFHRMKGELADREAAARAYAEELEQAMRVKSGEWPRLDLILLGMGSDGHTASLFPGSPGLKERTRWVCPNYSERLKSDRLTLTLPVLNAAAEIIFLVAGGDKAETLRAVLKGSAVDGLPASLLRPARGSVSWLVDESAARLLDRSPHGLSQKPEKGL
jgi:6-phosphogluconolactonase